MFVDLMNDIYNTFSERFLKVQLMFNEPAAATGARVGAADGNGRPAGGKPQKRYNAFGILEDVPPDESEGAATATGTDEVLDVAPAEPPKKQVAARRDPVVVGAGRARSLNQPQQVPADWTNVGRNDPCPCGSGKKFKKCHGASL